MTEPIKLESICPSCGKTDKLLWPEGCNNAWHREGEGVMSEIQRWDLEHDVSSGDDHVMVERADGEFLRYADHAAALRERDERIAALDQQLNEKESCIRKICEALGGNKEIPPWARVTTLRQQAERLSAPVTDAEWQQFAYEVKVVRSKDFATVMMLEYHQANALMAARKGEAS